MMGMMETGSSIALEMEAFLLTPDTFGFGVGVAAGSVGIF